MFRRIYQIAGITALLIVFGCSTEKNTFVTRSYHNITARYNIYFNGYESFNGGVLKLEKQYRDDYTNIIPVFNYSDEKIAQSIASDMDRAINKSTKVITFHSITAKPKTKKKYLTEKDKAFLQKTEYNKWIDDSYLLMGKSHFYKHDFALSVETFNFLIKRFNDEPSKHEALIWLARAYNEREDFRESEKILTLLQSDVYFPKKLRSSFNATYADFYLKQEEIDKCIPKLELALKYVKKKKNKLRYSFLLAQLYQQNGDIKKASEMYQKVIKKNPPYEMTFNAQMNLASLYQTEKSKGKNIREQLMKMLKDEKNKEFRDQIYYALGQVEMADNNLDKALEYFKMSAAQSVNNDNQKVKSYLTVADIYYEVPEYKLAQAYYDSAVAMIEEDYPDYNLIFNKSEYLSTLVKDLTTIEVEDSLQAMAKMSEADRINKIDAAIQALIAEENAAKQAQREAMMQNQYDRMNYQTDRTNATGQGKNWYFYNTQAVTIGKREFQTKWGARKLEDNWRRSVKRTVISEEVTDNQTNQNETNTEKVNLVTDRKKREYYLQYIPVTDSMMEASTNRVIEAYFEAGNIYKNDLEDYKQAESMYKDLNRRFPDNKYYVAAYYELYKLCQQNQDASCAEKYKNIIIGNHPESLYAKVLKNPNYFKELEAEQKKVSNLYEDTYNKFKAGYYAAVISNADRAVREFPDDVLIPKFKFLRAVAIGKTTNPVVFNEELKKFIAEFSESELKPKAEYLLASLSKTDEEVQKIEEQIKIEEQQAAAEELYKYEEGSKYYYLMVVNSQADVNQLNFNVINYNLDNYSESNFETSRGDVGTNYKMVRVFTIKTKKEALSYLKAINQVKDIFKDVNQTELYTFIISENNYQKFIKDGSVEKYMLFYNKYVIEK